MPKGDTPYELTISSATNCQCYVPVEADDKLALLADIAPVCAEAEVSVRAAGLTGRGLIYSCRATAVWHREMEGGAGRAGDLAGQGGGGAGERAERGTAKEGSWEIGVGIPELPGIARNCRPPGRR